MHIRISLPQRSSGENVYWVLLLFYPRENERDLGGGFDCGSFFYSVQRRFGLID